nr:fasciclin domain-containing protein [Flavobacterium sp. 9AF]
MADHAVANPALSTLTNLLSQQSLVPVLSGQTNAPFTVFAPSNTAFTTFENENPGTLASLTSEQVTSVLTYHVISGANVLSNAIPSGPITTLESGTLSITGTTITDEVSRETQIETSLVDIQTSNGIIHVINNVILPQL